MFLIPGFGDGCSSSGVFPIKRLVIVLKILLRMSLDARSFSCDGFVRR
jgi:uncharacterized membrane protein